MAKGIAAVVDAIFLLIIAAIASGMVLASASNYGENFNTQSQKLLLNYYAKQVVRSIVTASVFRAPNVPDYLLSYIKENVEAFKSIEKAEKELRNVVEKAMYPIRNRYDYVIMLDSLGTSWDTAYLFYRVTDSNGNVMEGNCTIDSYTYSQIQTWIDSIANEMYTSATTIYLRYCTTMGCFYIPADIRVILFPRGSTDQTPC